MKTQNLGMTIASLRKEKGMTQLELAEQMGVTDKAVSKWERGLSCPDIATLPRLAELFGVSVDELILGGAPAESTPSKGMETLRLICRAVPLAMGVAVVVLSAMGSLDVNSGFGLLGVGMACLGISGFLQDN